MKSNRNEDAVSPVIGVILMVAITVILAAVIAMFVIPMAQNVETTRTVGATAKQIGNESIVVTYFGGQDAIDVDELTVRINNEPAETMGAEIGLSKTFDTGTTGKDHVVIIATFNDGTEQVIYDSYI